jgi:hypothetical protein
MGYAHGWTVAFLWERAYSRLFVRESRASYIPQFEPTVQAERVVARSASDISLLVYCARWGDRARTKKLRSNGEEFIDLLQKNGHYAAPSSGFPPCVPRTAVLLPKNPNR